MPADQAYQGSQSPADGTSAFNAQSFLVRQILSGTWTAHPVIVKAVHQGAGALAISGTVDVQPMVNQIDGAGNAIPHGIIYGMQYLRWQGGANAIIMDPEVGDIGWAVFASHDISSVIANKAVANPGSRRRFDPADGLYLGGFLNAAPTVYVQFEDGDINIKGGTVKITADHATVISDDVNLGDTGGQAVARVGDTVNLSTGLITSGSAKVKAA